MTRVRPQLVFVDCETTGLDAARDRIIDLAAVRLGGDLSVTQRFTTLVNPRRPLPLLVSRLTGITDDELKEAPGFSQVYAPFRAFAQGAVIVGQNIAFDLAFLAAEAHRAGLPAPDDPSFDTLEAALFLFPELDRHGLHHLALHLGLEQPMHRALPDAEVTAALFAALCRRASGLAEPERRLLTAAGWRPLDMLDRFRLPPDAAPSPLVGAEPSGPAATGPAPLPCAEDGWRREFEPDGLGARLVGFRRRPGQTELAASVASLLADGGTAVFEAGTGMGKSLAYLLPAAFFSAARGSRVMVSTKTKALQRQLASHELPLVEAALPPGWRWSLLMGRENYICRRLLDEAVADAARALPDVDRTLALAYLLGRSRRGDVDLSALPYRASLVLPALTDVARELRSSASSCLQRRCPARARCHWRLARARAEAAHLVCVNHALLFTGLNLPTYENVIVDEAHLLPAEAMAAFSRRVERSTIDDLLRTLRGRRRQQPLAARVRTAAGNRAKQPADALRAAADGLERAAADLPGHASVLAAAVAELAEAARRARSEDESGADYDQSVWLTPGLRDLPAWDVFATATSLLSEALGALAAAGTMAADALPDEHRDAPQARSLADESLAASNLLAGLTDLDDPESVCWAEVESAARSGAGSPRPRATEGRWALTRAPLSAADSIRSALWNRLRSGVLTSATLTVGGSFAYYREQTGLGLDLDVREQVFASPFDYRRQAVLVLEHDPATPYSTEEAPARQAQRLKRLTELTGGRLLALFTNKRQMEQVAAAVGEHVESEGVVLLAQGVHGSAAALAEEFRAHPATVLLGVDTLWTGQDFPGDVLVCLVIAKLPFPRLDPLHQAQRLAYETAGRRWFWQCYLPEAVLRVRQGFGRLIRTETDRGVVVVLDHRLTQKAYTRDFLGSLPDLPVVRAGPDELADVVAYHLRRLNADAESADADAAG